MSLGGPIETQTIIAKVLPLALTISMFGLGLKLTVADFSRLLKMPRLVFIGLACQIVLLPLIAFAIAKTFNLSPVLAMGLMILAAAPGGVTANLMSHFAGGNVALNVTLTALNSLTAVLTLPFLIEAAYAHFFGQGAAIPADAAKILQVLVVVMVPMGIGMILKAKKPGLASKLLKPINVFSILFLIFVAIGAIFKERELIAGGIGPVGLAVLIFNLCSYAVGYGIPRLLKTPRAEAIAIAMEVGIHNGTLAITIATSAEMMNSMPMAVPAALYTVIMYMTGAVWIQVLKRTSGPMLTPRPLS